MAEAGLGLEALAAADEEGGDVVAEAVQGRVGNAGRGAEPGEAMPERARRDRALMIAVAAEHPRSNVCFGGPFVVESCPDGSGRGPYGEAASVPGLGGRDLGSGDGPADGEGAGIEVVEAQGGELAASSAGVGGETQQEQVLFGDAATRRRHDEVGVVSLATASSSPVDAGGNSAVTSSLTWVSA